MSQFDEAEIIFNVRKLDVSYEWTWDVECDVCAICRNDIVDSCMRCQADNCSKICPIGNFIFRGHSKFTSYTSKDSGTVLQTKLSSLAEISNYFVLSRVQMKSNYKSDNSY